MSIQARIAMISLVTAFLVLAFVPSPASACWRSWPTSCDITYSNDLACSDFWRSAFPYSPHFLLPSYATELGISRLAAWRYASYLVAGRELDPPEPLRVENPYFASADVARFDAGESTPQPLRVENPFFDAK